MGWNMSCCRAISKVLASTSSVWERTRYTAALAATHVRGPSHQQRLPSPEHGGHHGDQGRQRECAKCGPAVGSSEGVLVGGVQVELCGRSRHRAEPGASSRGAARTGQGEHAGYQGDARHDGRAHNLHGEDGTLCAARPAAVRRRRHFECSQTAHAPSSTRSSCRRPARIDNRLRLCRTRGP